MNVFSFRSLNYSSKNAVEAGWHVVRKGDWEKLVLEGKIKGVRQRGRRGLSYMEELVLAAGLCIVEVLQRMSSKRKVSDAR